MILSRSCGTCWSIDLHKRHLYEKREINIKYSSLWAESVHRVIHQANRRLVTQRQFEITGEKSAESKRSERRPEENEWARDENWKAYRMNGQETGTVKGNTSLVITSNAWNRKGTRDQFQIASTGPYPADDNAFFHCDSILVSSGGNALHSSIETAIHSIRNGNVVSHRSTFYCMDSNKS